MHYVTRISHQMQKHKFGLTFLAVLFRKPHQAHLCMKNCVSTFRALNALEFTTAPTYPTGCKNTSSAQHVLVSFLWKPHQAHPIRKKVCQHFVPGRTRMHYVTHRSH
jgi:hypothetical protein